MAGVSLPPGTSDIFPEESHIWHEIEQVAAEVFSLYGFGELRTPIMEFTELFQRGIGDETDVVKKEMYTFNDRGGRSLTLRPEGTAGVMRALSKTDVMNGSEKRVYYIGPMFRGERPAAGRKRQFHQVGVENAGGVSPAADAESIAMLMHFLEKLKITGSKLLINTRGAFEDRKPAEDLLRIYFKNHLDVLCHDCQERYDRNIWRLLDCKNPTCGEIVNGLPNITESFSEESQSYFKEVCELLDVMNIDYIVEPRLVRGLDYYAHTVFELTHDALGGQNAIAGGGRYEVNIPGVKRPVKGVGFAAGIERLIMVRDALKVVANTSNTPYVYLVSLGKEAKKMNIKLAKKLRSNGISCIAELEDKSIKAQLRAANKYKVSFALIRGEDELNKGVVVCRNLENGEQSELKDDGTICEFLKEQIPNLH
jgi:histidyl-tRNA synthetase